MKVHPVAELFPILVGEELDELVNSIKAEGLLNPCVTRDGVLLDGRNRLKACRLAGVEPRFTEYAGESEVAFIIGQNLKRRHLTIGQKLALAIELEPYFAAEAKRRQGSRNDLKPAENIVGQCPTKSKSRDQAAAAVGISGKTVSAGKALKEAAPELYKKVTEDKVSLAKAKKELKAEQDKRQLAKAQQEITAEKQKKLEAVCDLRVCSCAELFASGIKPDAVITDPPYPKEFLPCFTELAEGCAEARVPLVAVMSGQSYLPEVFDRLCSRLVYRWTLAYLTPGGQAVQQWTAKVNTAWKPVLLFGEAKDWFGDTATSAVNDNDKRFHGWGQSESGMADLVERLTKPGQLVCDPFMGGGTTAVVCLALGRRFVGCDIDASHVASAKARVSA